MAAVSPARRRERVVERNSVLRASILDTALELGVADSSAVARWMFNPLQEVDEDAESMVSPSLTYASTATSEESAYGSNFRHHRPGAGASTSNSFSSQSHSPAKSGKPSLDDLGYSRNDGLTPEPGAQRAIHFDLSNTPEPRAPSPMPPPAKSAKLRKAKPDGYESDGGYVSDGTKSNKEKEKKKSKKKLKEDGNVPGEESDGGYLSEFSSRKRKEKKKAKKEKEALEKSMTDGESDGGYISMTFGKGRRDRAAAAKAANAAAGNQTGDESDGAYLSESSVKKRSRFFRMNGKSSRKKNSPSEAASVVPPVPSLPPMQLKIADMFAKGEMPFSEDSRTVTPVPSERTAVETRSLNASTRTYDTSISSMEPSLNSSVEPSIGVQTPLDSPKAIPNVFIDAGSIRSPSTDLLATFGQRNLSQVHTPVRAKGPSLDTISTNSSAESPAALQATSPLRKPTVPMISMPRPKKNPSAQTVSPQISAPNTHALMAKHTPVPLILTPPTPAASARSFGKHSPSSGSAPDTGDTLSPWNRTPDVPRSPSQNSRLSSGNSPLPSPTTPNNVRPHVLAYYDLPPPSPPPSGPLPRVPPIPSSPRHDWSQQRAPSPVWKSELSPGGPNSSSSTGLSPSNRPSSPLFLQRIPASQQAQRGRESPFPVAPAPLPDEPLTRTMSIQRGRNSPFPTQPVLPRQESADLVRRTSIARGNSPTGSNTRPMRLGTKMVNISGPMSADVYSHQQRAVIPQQKLDAHWQPRSASALDNHTRPSEDSQRSWIDYGDYGDEEEDVILDYRRPSSDEQDLSQEGSESIYHDEDPNIYSTYAHDQNQDVEDVDVRSTQFFDAEDSDGEGSTEKANRYSVWSAKSRMSILDGERSGDVRQKFVQRVEAMYGKSTIPPVPKLPSPKSRPGMF